MSEFELGDFGNEENRSKIEKDSGEEITVPSIKKGQVGQNVNLNNSSSTYSYTQWSEVFFDTFIATGDSRKSLPAGLYIIKEDNYGRLNFIKKPIHTDDLLNFTDSISDKILREINSFWKLGKDFRDYGFLHRRGYLLYGPPGGGKSVTVQQIISGLIKNGGIALWADGHPQNIIEGVQILRKVEPTRHIVVVFEDIDAIIDKFGEAAILSYLDGEGNVDTLLNIATTNYPRKLDQRIVARPRRFDRVEKIGMPNISIRREYFKAKINLEGEELEQWVESTKDFSFAALADLIISVKCFKYTFEEAIEKLKKLLDAKFVNDEFKTSNVGFGNNGH